MSWKDKKEAVQQKVATQNVESMPLSKLPDKAITSIVLGIGLPGQDGSTTLLDKFNPVTYMMNDGSPAVLFYNIATIFAMSLDGEKATSLRWHFTDSPEDPIVVLGHNQSRKDIGTRYKKFNPLATFFVPQPNIVYHIPAAIIGKDGRNLDYTDVTYCILELNGSQFDKIMTAYAAFVADPSNENVSFADRVFNFDRNSKRKMADTYMISMTGSTMPEPYLSKFSQYVRDQRAIIDSRNERIYNTANAHDGLQGPAAVWAYIQREITERELGYTLAQFKERFSLIDDSMPALDVGEEVDLNPFAGDSGLDKDVPF